MSELGSEELRELSLLDPSQLVDAGLAEPLSQRIRPLSPQLRICGPCRTVRGGPGCGVSIAEGILTIEPGEVLVIGGFGEEHACLGELFARELIRRGCAGVVVDGAVRDVAALRALEWPVFASALTPRAVTSGVEGAIQVPLSIGPTAIHPGDVVVGDADGVVAVDRDARDLDVVREIRQRETAAAEAIGRGECLGDLTPYDALFREAAASLRSRGMLG